MLYCNTYKTIYMHNNTHNLNLQYVGYNYTLPSVEYFLTTLGGRHLVLLGVMPVILGVTLSNHWIFTISSLQCITIFSARTVLLFWHSGCGVWEWYIYTPTAHSVCCLWGRGAALVYWVVELEGLVARRDGHCVGVVFTFPVRIVCRIYIYMLVTK